MNRSNRKRRGRICGLLREDVNDLLLVKEGDFLIRKSEETSGQDRIYVLFVVAGGHKHHLFFRSERGRVVVDFKHEGGFRTIRRFIETHVTKGDTVVDQGKVILLKGVGRQKLELAHSTITQGAELGKGAFGVVKRGVFRDPTIGQPVQVAIKEVSQTSTKAQTKEFMNEARIMRHLEHKNVIRFCTFFWCFCGGTQLVMFGWRLINFPPFPRTNKSICLVESHRMVPFL
ncbi:hypothetical protein niasHT_013427 [Heterodera trifolii]|uniref:Non-specific protein-tyrosine kinase n=1 Tax=Heterodera trifolii TaxID=157864 RepID=A0ABD2LDJ4_9BILA